MSLASHTAIPKPGSVIRCGYPDHPIDCVKSATCDICGFIILRRGDRTWFHF